MTTASIISRPTDDQFARVDQVKIAVGDTPLPGDERFWILGVPLEVRVDNTEDVVVVKGFTTDGASVPDWAQRLTGWEPWADPQRWAGIVHDWLYAQRGYGRHRADRVLRAVLASEGADWLRRHVMYLAVRIGGGDAYAATQQRGPRIFV